MKTKTIAVLVPFIAAGLFLAGPAQAQQSIPGIKQTDQWRDLKAYVDQLESKRKTPATTQQKDSFRARLTAKQSSTNERVKRLYSQRLQRVINRDQEQEQRQIRKLVNASNKQVDQLRDQRAGRIASAKSDYANTTALIRDRYAGAIGKDNRQLKTLRKNLRRTKDPFRRTIILQHIETIQSDVTALRQARQNDLDDAADTYRNRIAAIRNRFASNIRDTRNYYDGLIKQVQKAWKRIYADDVAALKAQREREFRLVTNLRNRGGGYIDQMPPKRPVR